MELLAQLTFSEKVKNDINSSKEMQPIFYKLAKLDAKKVVAEKRDQNVLVFIKSLIEIINWNLSGNEARKSASLKENSLVISHKSQKTDDSLKLKQRLESMGNKVYLSCTDTTSLESTLNEIDKSEWVLLCITEKYRQSNFCRAVANYALQKDKRIVALIMQEQSYETLMGWLKVLMTTNASLIDCTKCDFDQFVQKLNDIFLHKNDF
jgi:hypothetical protein